MKYCYFLLFFFILHFSGQAQSRNTSYKIDSFYVELDVSADGKLSVKEQIDVDFLKESRGIIRVIPMMYDFDGVNHLAPPQNIDVSNFKFHISEVGHEKRIRIGDALVYLTGPQTYEIKYSVNEAVIAYENHAEVYWNLTGSSWDAPIEKMSFRVNLPKDINLSEDQIRLWVGSYGSTSQDVIYSYEDGVLLGAVTKTLNPKEGVTVALQLPKNYFSGIPSFESIKAKSSEIGKRGRGYTLDAEKNKWWYLLLPFGLFAGIWSWWKNRRRKNASSSPIEMQYYPPEGLTSAHVGAYVDHKVHKRDVISLIPYWATEGFIKVRGLEDGDMQLIKLKKLPDNFPDYEHEFFNAIFEEDEVISFSSAQHKYGPIYFKVKQKLTKEIENAGYYDANYVYLFKTWRWPLICVAIVCLGIYVLSSTAFLFFGIGLIILGILFFSFSFVTAPLSEFGQKVHDHLVGLSDFLQSGDDEKIAQLDQQDPKYFSHMLPYAVAFGLDEQWLKTYEKVSTKAPSWFESYHGGYYIVPDFRQFRKSFKTADITQAFTSFPKIEASKGGSAFGGSGGLGGGFSGGGFSGGGFGGGGGTSW